MNLNHGTSCMYVYHVHLDTFLYVMILQMHAFDIYVRHDIMRTFLFMWRLMACNVLCPTKSGPRGTYTCPSGGLMCVYVSRV